MRFETRLLVLILAFGLLATPALAHGRLHHHHRWHSRHHHRTQRLFRQALPLRPLCYAFSRYAFHLYYSPRNRVSTTQAKCCYHNSVCAVCLGYFEPSNGNLIDLMINDGVLVKAYLDQLHRPVLVVPSDADPYLLFSPSLAQVKRLEKPGNGIYAAALDKEAHEPNDDCPRAMIIIRNGMLVIYPACGDQEHCWHLLDQLGIPRNQAAYCDSDTTQLVGAKDRTVLVVTTKLALIAERSQKPRLNSLLFLDQLAVTAPNWLSEYVELK